MTRTRWTADELATLRALYPVSRAEDVAAALGRPVKTIYSQANALGLRKSAEFLASQASGRVRRGQQHPRMVATQFKAGNEPWNKGREHPAARLNPNVRATQFKPGQVPYTWQPLGSLRIAISKGIPVLERKVAETPGPSHRRWVPVARLVWQAAHGPLPEGHIVVFRSPELRTTELDLITLDRLECISRAENARRNHAASRGPELAGLVQLKGAITRQVNRISREAGEPQQPPARRGRPVTGQPGQSRIIDAKEPRHERA